MRCPKVSEVGDESLVPLLVVLWSGVFRALEVKVCVIPDKKRTALHGIAESSLFGGAGGIRTPDLFIANEVLSQLSYSPGHTSSLHKWYYGRHEVSLFSKLAYALADYGSVSGVSVSDSVWGVCSVTAVMVADISSETAVAVVCAASVTAVAVATASLLVIAPMSVISNIRVAFAGILGGEPADPYA